MNLDHFHARQLTRAAPRAARAGRLSWVAPLTAHGCAVLLVVLSLVGIHEHFLATLEVYPAPSASTGTGHRLGCGRGSLGGAPGGPRVTNLVPNGIRSRCAIVFVEATNSY